jgi:hypothetical protein
MTTGTRSSLDDVVTAVRVALDKIEFKEPIDTILVVDAMCNAVRAVLHDTPRQPFALEGVVWDRDYRVGSVNGRPVGVQDLAQSALWALALARLETDGANSRANRMQEENSRLLLRGREAEEAVRNYDDLVAQLAAAAGVHAACLTPALVSRQRRALENATRERFSGTADALLQADETAYQLATALIGHIKPAVVSGGEVVAASDPRHPCAREWALAESVRLGVEKRRQEAAVAR